MSKIDHRSGFTLIELLIVIAILTVLFAIVIIAVNPVRQLAQADNTQRRSDINSIINAVYQYAADNRGTLPADIPSTTTIQIGRDGTGVNCAISCNGVTTPTTCLDLHASTTPTYLTDIPHDPDVNGTTTTYYGITRSDTNNRITVVACQPELGESISITR